MSAEPSSSKPSSLSPPEPRWIDPVAPPPGPVSELADALKLPPALCRLLVARGVDTPEAARAYLRPELSHLHDPATLRDGPEAAARLARAVASGETILVHGDYDVDGVCATALYTRWIRRLGGRVVPFVPHRLRDGYDFGEAGLRAARDAGATVILTADCGTTALEPIARARAEGVDVVVTDHHTMPAALPPASALVNPQRGDCAYPDKGLCGTGVALKVCVLLAREVGADPDDPLEFLDLVALATVADLVPLTGENRVFVRYGMRRFARTRVAGLVALMEAAGVAADEVDAAKLGFALAPRINAVGRMGEAADALRLLLTDEAGEARRLAERCDAVNRVRQEEDRRTLAQALEMLARDYDPERDYGVVLASEGWHPGVIGIVASRVAETIHRPAVLIALDGDGGRGSARSIPGFHLYDALAACAPHMRRFGGHRQAAGMDVDRAAIPMLRRAFNAEARRRLAGEEPRPTLRPDLELRLSDIGTDFMRYLDYAAPHGMGNPRPVFLVRSVRVDEARAVGRGHLKATLRQGGALLGAIGFGLAERHPPNEVNGREVDVAFRLHRDTWRGVPRIQAKIAALRPAAGASAER